MKLKEIVLATTVGTLLGAGALIGGSIAVGNYYGERNMQRQYGVGVKGVGATDLDKQGDFVVDYWKHFLIAGAVAGTAFGVYSSKKRF